MKLVINSFFQMCVCFFSSDIIYLRLDGNKYTQEALNLFLPYFDLSEVHTEENHGGFKAVNEFLSVLNQNKKTKHSQISVKHNF